MTPVALRFERVSKRYQLGVSRTSLPAVVSQWVKRAARGGPLRAPRQFHWALDDVSFELEGGGALALIGPNGAGKSTALKLLSRITEPTSGRIEVAGKISALIELGAGFHPDLTGVENVFLNGTILGLERRDIARRLEAIIEFSELDRFIDTPLKRYSSGMTIRLGFAVAACMDPEILLVDEVLAVGDASFQRKCITRIRELQGRGTSLIFVSHNLGLIKAVCRTAILLERGKVAANGPVTDVVEKYNELLETQRAEALASGPEPGDRAVTDLEITSVEVLDAAGQRGAAISSESRVEVRVSYVAYRPLGVVDTLVRIYRSDGLSCCVVRASEDGVRPSIAQGRGFFALALDPLQLSGGTYHAVAWMLDSDGANGLARGASDWFRVAGGGRARKADDSVFEPRHEWRTGEATPEPAVAAASVPGERS